MLACDASAVGMELYSLTYYLTDQDTDWIRFKVLSQSVILSIGKGGFVMHIWSEEIPFVPFRPPLPTLHRSQASVGTSE